MKTVLSTRTVLIPEGGRFLPNIRKPSYSHPKSLCCTVDVEVSARLVKVKGPLGSLERKFSSTRMDIRKVKGADVEDCVEGDEEKDFVKVDLWFAVRKQLASVRTVCSHIENMITGVTKGFLYKLRFVYSHFPINVTLNGDMVEIRNFLGEKRVRKVKLLPGVKYVRTADVKDQIELSGIDIAAVSLTAAQIQQMTNVRKKDLRKFLDGIYVSEKGVKPDE